MASNWRDGLQPGSFRGAPFHTAQRDGSGGQRGEDHQFPKRDTPWAQKMGRQQKRWRVQAYVIGDDYMAKRDAVIDALDAAEGTLVDHWAGERRALCRSYSYSEFADEGRWCVFDCEFVDPGSVAPTAGIPGFAMVAGAASSLISTAASRFGATIAR